MKTDTPEYMLQRVITKTVHARTLVSAVDNRFIGNREQWIAEARELLHDSRDLLDEVLDKWPDRTIL